jgi:predicted dehydrogenase
MPPQALRLGVIGLGPNWANRYRPALAACKAWFDVRVLCDQAPRASLEANRLGCAAADGVGDLLATPELDTVLFADKQWFGLWPLELLCRQPKPVLCVPPITADGDRAANLALLVRQAQLPVMFEMRPRFTPATVRLRRLLHRFGDVRLMLCETDAGTTSEPEEGAPPASGSGGCAVAADFFELFDWCMFLMRSKPARVRMVEAPAGGAPALRTVLLEFPDGRVAQINRIAHGDEKVQQAQIFTATGLIHVRQPDRVRWHYRHMESAEHVPGRQPLEVRVLRQFHRLAAGASGDAPGIDAAEAALQVAAMAREEQ